MCGSTRYLSDTYGGCIRCVHFVVRPALRCNCGNRDCCGYFGGDGPDARFFRMEPVVLGAHIIRSAVSLRTISNPPGSRACDRGGSCGCRDWRNFPNSHGSVANADAIASGGIDQGSYSPMLPIGLLPAPELLQNPG